MKYDFTGKNEREAIEIAARELGLEQDKFDVEILETQKATLFKKGYVKIRVYTDGAETGLPGNLDPPERAAAPPRERDRDRGHDRDRQPARGREPERERQPLPEGYEPLSTPRVIADPLPQGDFEHKLVEFVATVVQKMGYEATIEVMMREPKKLILKLNSSQSSILIGRKGKNLDALQMLANVYADRLGQGDLRVILDTENYRIRHEEALVRLAYNSADKVRTRGGSMLLEPMNPFERRIIHTALNDIADVETKSEGEGLYKQVRVSMRGGYDKGNRSRR
jgi:spoIIIJ-associated protein